VAVGYGFYHFSLTWFKEHKSSEKVIALQLVDAFVTNYSAVRAQFGSGAPVPASFRAHAIEAFNKQNGDNSEFRLSSVGRPGREIVTPPADAQMARTIEAFAATPNPKAGIGSARHQWRVGVSHRLPHPGARTELR
jgi:hypothetical protein